MLEGFCMSESEVFVAHGIEFYSGIMRRIWGQFSRFCEEKD